MNIAKIAAGLGGQVIAGELLTEISGFSIDSRSVKKGELFFAIKGPHNDGHDYIGDAVENGAAGVVVSDIAQCMNCEIVIKTGDTTKALGLLANYKRNSCKAKVIGVTGSCGKTTTKRLLTESLSRDHSVHFSEGNFNNLYGLPLSLLKCTGLHEFSVCEMGISYPGEMAKLSMIAEPDAIIFTNIHPVHLGHFRNTEHIAESKMEAVSKMKKDGMIILNGDCAELIKASQKYTRNKILFGTEKHSNFRLHDFVSSGVSGSSFKITEKGRKPVPFESHLPGLHNAMNILAAASCASVFGEKLEKSAEAFSKIKPEPGRGEISVLKSGIMLVDESYNSNPESLKAVVEMLSETEGFQRKILVAGDMLELGERETELHISAGNHIAKSPIAFLVTVGSLSSVMGESVKGTEIEHRHFKNSDEAGKFAAGMARNGDLFVVKGSRGIMTEKIINKLKSLSRID